MIKLKKYEIDALVDTVVDALIKKAKDKAPSTFKLEQAAMIVDVVHKIRSLDKQKEEMIELLKTLPGVKTVGYGFTGKDSCYNSVESLMAAALKDHINNMSSSYSDWGVRGKIQTKIITANISSDADIAALIDALIEEFSKDVEI